MSSTFALQPSPLDNADSTWGQVAVIPWDSACFGFNVGTYLPDPGADAVPADGLRQRLNAWMAAQQVEMLSCTVPAQSAPWMACLATAGFAFVDMAMLAFGRRLDTLPPARISVRDADVADHGAIIALAGSAFAFGRYHTDARFPRDLADARYRLWATNALAADPSTNSVLVTGPVGQPTGFVCATVEGHRATLTLAAVDPVANPGILGPLIMVSALRELAARGARTAQARVAAANTSIMSLYSGLGFSFPDAEAVYHLHAPGAPHLRAIR